MAVIFLLPYLLHILLILVKPILFVVQNNFVLRINQWWFLVRRQLQLFFAWGFSWCSAYQCYLQSWSLLLRPFYSIQEISRIRSRLFLCSKNIFSMSTHWCFAIPLRIDNLKHLKNHTHNHRIEYYLPHEQNYLNLYCWAHKKDHKKNFKATFD